MVVALIASSVALGNGAVVAQESEESQTSESPSAGASAESPKTTSGGWWDGTGAPAAAPPRVVEEGSCGSHGGSLALFGGGPLAKVCAGTAGVSGSPRGVGWSEGLDVGDPSGDVESYGPYVEVELFGGPAVGAAAYRALGVLDVVFDGGTFSADFSACTHRGGAGWSSCVTRVPGAPLAPGAFVGAATTGAEAPTRSLRAADEAATTPAAERAALVAFYNATGGTGWRLDSNWDTAAPVDDWYGVSTGTDGSVTSLYLHRNALSGTIPAELGDLTNLQYLNLAWNSLSGTIPAELGDLTNLEHLDLSANSLSGAIPAVLGDLTNLRDLDLARNSLSGAIPAELGDLTNLERLYLSFNDLSGTIPVELGGLTRLRNLNLSANDLSGAIPAELGDLTNLDILYLASNGLSGPIPAELGNVTNLNELSLAGNGLSGPIPAELGAITYLERLLLTRNNLSGLIPAELGDLMYLDDLYLSDNSLSGPIPARLSRLTGLDRLYLSDNELSGSIPTGLGRLTRQHVFDVSDNSFTGCVPAPLATVLHISFDPDISYCETSQVAVMGAVLVGGTTVGLIYDSDLNEASVPSVTAFSLSVDGLIRAPTAVTVEERMVTLNLSPPVSPAGDVTLSYTVPSAADAGRIESTDGDAATSLSSWLVEIGPEPPTIAFVESVTGGLTVYWESVAHASGYDVEWQQDGEITWQPTDTYLWPDSLIEATIGGLDDGVLYWIRVRSIKTDGGPFGHTLYASDWSAAQPGIAGDWAPQNLEVSPADQMLTVTWDDVPAATGYEVSYWPLGEYSELRSASPIRVGAGWGAHIAGLDNGETYGIEVLSVRRLPLDADRPAGVTETLTSEPAYITGEPSIAFQVVSDDSPLFVRTGGVVERRVRLVYEDAGLPSSGVLPVQRVLPFASRSMGAGILTGPSAGQTVQCRPLVPPGRTVLIASFMATGDAPRGQCETDDEGRLTLVYTAVLPSGDSVGNTDHVRLHVDPNKNQQRDPHEPFVILDPAVAIVRPINYGALGDSYSSGEHGELTDDRPADDLFKGTYLDEECRRWTLAYPFLLAGSPNYSSLGFYACAGAVTSDVYVPAGSGVFSGQSSLLHTLNTGLDLGFQRNVDMVTITIGGNDVGFAAALRDCYKSGCDSDSLTMSVEDVRIELRKVLQGLKAAARDATIFVLGYPQLVPHTPRAFCRALNMDSVVDAIDDRFPKKRGYSFGERFQRTALNNLGNDSGRDIGEDERQFLRDTGHALNAVISDVAGDEGVHFVAVASEFEGHEPCGEKNDDWLNGLLGERVDAHVVDSPDPLAISDRSFHPNAAGHREYARILRDYIEDAVRGSHIVNNAGLPNNPPAKPAPRGVAGSPGGSAKARSAGESSEGAESSDATAPAASAGSATGFLWARRVVSAVSACAAPFAPGDQVELFAAGFAPDSAVTFSVVGVIAPAVDATSVVTLSPSPAIAAATADASGRLEVTWTIPDAPDAPADPAPRAYVVEASGTDGSGDVFAARSVAPLVVYPGVAPCAVDDTAETSLGRPVRIPVLANDVAPAGGSLDAASVIVDGVRGGGFVVDGSDGSLTFTPDPGFAGTVTTRYWVYDGWDIGVSAVVTVTVDAGCTITGAVGATAIEGTEGDDVICVADPDDWDAFHIIDAKAGDDVIIGGDGVDWIYGGAGADVVYGRDGRDLIDGGVGVDTIYGGDGFDTVYSVDLADVVRDDADGYELLLTAPARSAHAAPVPSDDAAFAAPGETLDIAVLDNDVDPNGNLVAASLSIASAPTLGAAFAIVSAGGDVVVRYIAGDTSGADSLTYEVCDTLNTCATAQVSVTIGTAHCTIVGTDGDDVLRGTPGADVICGLGGDDVINGIGGDDVIVGGPGDDTLFGGNGNDTLHGGPGNDTLTGGAEADTLWGGPGDDTLEGNTQNDTLVGGPGNDSLNGGGGDDVLWAGTGDDTLIGHAGNDTLHGGPGDDTMDDGLTGGNGDDVLFGGPGGDTLAGGAGADTLWGGPGDDSLWGNTQNDTLWGGEGNDTLYGGGHDDALLGGAGNDVLYGNAGDDRLWGNTGDDALNGGNDSDYTNGGDDTDSCTRGEITARCEV